MLISLKGGSAERFRESFRALKALHRRRSLRSKGCDQFRLRHARFRDEQARLLKEIVERSDSLLKPFLDPLRSDLTFSGIVAFDREESYTAALDWLVRRVSPDSVHQIFGLPYRRTPKSAFWNTTREYWVSHESRSGRIDLHLLRNPCQIVVEVKTAPYTEEHLEKHDLYIAATKQANGDLEACDFVFVALEDDGVELHGFQFRSWRRLCLSLRRCIPQIKECLSASEVALFLALLGAIEQNLLGLHLDGVENAPRTVAYLTEYMNSHEE